MKFTFYSPISFEDWDWRTPDETGIGGSETAVCELSRRLALRGHDVVVYAPIREDCPQIDPGGAKWLRLPESAPSLSPLLGGVAWGGVGGPERYTYRISRPLNLKATGGMSTEDTSRDAFERHPWNREGIWVLSRCPQVLDRFPVDHPGQQLWLVCQDISYPFKDMGGYDIPGGLTPWRAEKLDLCLPLCREQELHIHDIHPEVRGKTRLSTNGINVDIIRSLENNARVNFQGVDGGTIGRSEVSTGVGSPEQQGLSFLPRREDGNSGHVSNRGFSGDLGTSGLSVEVPRRDPYRIIYTSSPDRGLPALLKIFKRAKEFEPRLTLHAAYGFDNIDKCKGNYWRYIKEECEKYFGLDGVTWLGRLPREKLYAEMLSAGLWVYPTTFAESSCITCMEAQACGAIPITNPYWALGQNVKHGVFLKGDPEDPLIASRYLGEILRLTRCPELQDQIRSEMMGWARTAFNWERIVDQYEALALGFADRPFYSAQYAFQLKHAKGRILNIGSNSDVAGFGDRGAVNLDILPNDPYTNQPNRVDVLADARNPLPFSKGSFDSVILGDILEHMDDEDAIKAIRNAAAVLNENGDGNSRVIITCPEDYRPVDRQHDHRELQYTDGVRAFHSRPITEDTIRSWLSQSGLKVDIMYEIDYGFCKGHGVVAKCS